jgi:hypothetical protein
LPEAQVVVLMPDRSPTGCNNRRAERHDRLSNRPRRSRSDNSWRLAAARLTNIKRDGRGERRAR